MLHNSKSVKMALDQFSGKSTGEKRTSAVISRISWIVLILTFIHHVDRQVI